MQPTKPLVALAFSGGLDTSYCVPRLTEDGWAVETVFVNTGGSTPEERAAIRRQAEAVGALRHHEVDAVRDDGRFQHMRNDKAQREGLGDTARHRELEG